MKCRIDTRHRARLDFIDSFEHRDRLMCASGVLPEGTTVEEAKCTAAQSLIIAIDSVLRGTLEHLRGLLFHAEAR